jgi:eukaryotic-like serine/threonine-protein kinase
VAGPPMNLASNLVGHVVGGWRVEKKISKDGGTGGCFSSGYLVSDKDGRQAFLKAINIGYALKNRGGIGVDRTALLKDIASEFEHEKALLSVCADKRLDRIVHAIDTGEYEHPSDSIYVPYLVFELCKEGDVRRHPKMQDPKLAWRLRVFHGVAVGVHQLHCSDIFHQDLKPSNVLIAAGNNAKIADLGRATTSSPSALYAEAGHWGDSGYTPIEFRYSYYHRDTLVRRCAADFYMLGGILAFMCSNTHILVLRGF